MGKHSHKRAAYDPTKIKDVEEGKAFLQLSLELISSDAWKDQSIHCRRLIDRLEIEHMCHAGRENGRLVVTFLQFHKHGVGKQYISKAIKEAEKLGLLRVKRGAKKSFKETYHSRYRLTYLRSIEVNGDGQTYYAAPTNEWRRYRSPTSENESQGYDSVPDKDTIGGCAGIQSYPAEALEAAETLEAPTPSKCIPPYISWGEDGSASDVAPTSSPTIAGAEQPITSPTDLDQPTIRQVGRQRHGQDEPNPDAPSLLDYINAQKDKATATAQTSPTDRLRADLRAKLATLPKGTHKRLAERVGVKSCTLSNFLSKGGPRYSPNACAEGLLREWAEGRLDLDQGRHAA